MGISGFREWPLLCSRFLSYCTRMNFELVFGCGARGLSCIFFCTFAARNWTIIIIETIILTLAFTAMILIPLVKNPVWWIADYPEDIQEEYIKTHERIPSKFFTPTVLLKKGMALLIALALLLVVVKLAGAYDFWSALAVGYGIWLFIDWYDCFFLDWVLFANTPSTWTRPITRRNTTSCNPAGACSSASSLALSGQDFTHGCCVNTACR